MRTIRVWVFEVTSQSKQKYELCFVWKRRNFPDYFCPSETPAPRSSRTSLLPQSRAHGMKTSLSHMSHIDYTNEPPFALLLVKCNAEVATKVANKNHRIAVSACVIRHRYSRLSKAARSPPMIFCSEGTNDFAFLYM